MKAKSPNESWQSIRGRYTWHLRQKTFDRSHWWPAKPAGVDPVAALYELARRHPSVGLRMTRPWDGETMPAAVICLCDIGLKSWPKLTLGQKAVWKGCAGNLKGIDCRTDEEKCYDIAWQDEGEPLNQVVVSRKHKTQKRKKFTVAKIGFTAAEIEAGIARRAIEAYRQGHVLLAIAPGIAQDEAAALLAGKYRERRQFDKAAHGAGKQRVRPKDWLRLVAQFDEVAASSGGVNSRGFNSYRKAIDGLCF